MSKTIVALDFSSEKEVLDFLKQFDHPIYVKIGMELTYACGLGIVEKVKAMGHHVFLDLKLHDIPNTVKGGMKNLAKLGVDMTNVHCSGGIAMMKAAIEGLEEGAKGKKRPLCIGVTQLTSTSKEAMNEEQVFLAMCWIACCITRKTRKKRAWMALCARCMRQERSMKRVEKIS